MGSNQGNDSLQQLKQQREQAQADGDTARVNDLDAQITQAEQQAQQGSQSGGQSDR